MAKVGTFWMRSPGFGLAVLREEQADVNELGGQPVEILPRAACVGQGHRGDRHRQAATDGAGRSPDTSRWMQGTVRRATISLADH
jgi:hypothetical protein